MMEKRERAQQTSHTQGCPASEAHTATPNARTATTARMMARRMVTRVRIGVRRLNLDFSGFYLKPKHCSVFTATTYHFCAEESLHIPNWVAFFVGTVAKFDIQLLELVL